MSSLKQSALAVTVCAGEDDKTRLKVDVGIDVVAETGQFQSGEMDVKPLNCWIGVECPNDGQPVMRIIITASTQRAIRVSAKHTLSQPNPDVVSPLRNSHHCRKGINPKGRADRAQSGFATLNPLVFPLEHQGGGVCKGIAVVRFIQIAALAALLAVFAVACVNTNPKVEFQMAQSTPVQPVVVVEPTRSELPATPTVVPTNTVAPVTSTPAIIATATAVPTSTAISQTTPTRETAERTVPDREWDIVSLLPPDAIPAIDNPIFFETLDRADAMYDDDEIVLGVEIDGDARAYSVPLLSSHEIVNDTVAGNPIAVTW